MKRALLLSLLIGGCGGDGTPANEQAAPAPTETVAAPIDNIAQNRVDNAVPVPPARPKLLVSRETSSPQKPHIAYRAIGTEPFWAVTLRGSTATQERPDKAPIDYAISRNAGGRAIRYLGDGFAMTVTQGPCSDGMSDAVWSDRVQISFGEGTLKGCGGTREEADDAP